MDGMEEEGGRGSGQPIVGEAHTLLSVRGATVDQGDGGVVASFEVNGDCIPEEYATSAVNTVWQVTVVESGTACEPFYASRLSTKDLKGGMAALRLSALAADMAGAGIYGRKGREVVLQLAMTAGHPRHARGLDKAERALVLRRCFAHCHEPEFLDWLESEAKRRGYPVQRRGGLPSGAEPTDAPTTEDRAAEYIYLLARIHSRHEVVESATAANAVDELVRAYRVSLWRIKGVAAERRDGTG